ncbi:hypothetical protein Glove_724g34 [Diversispora epigaea]|uniref:Uncharacterized protein n=1 Tax=Diversispora epigaea TaxID=1348612 RepID=A0A397G0A1_9GLOM|nr:hypothetical protein Glove_724g34 [Diversispora epigaea]
MQKSSGNFHFKNFRKNYANFRKFSRKIAEIFEIDSETGPGLRIQAYYKGGFLDLDIEVPWPVPFPNDKEHRAIWQNGIQTAKDMFKVDGAEYVFSTWFTTAKEIKLASVILGAKNEDELIQAVFLECLYHNYSEEEINENMEIALDAYRASDKGSKAWLEYVEQQIESKKFEAGMTEKRAQEILNAIDNGEFLIRVKFIRADVEISPEGEYIKRSFKIKDKYEPIRESKRASGKYVRGGPNVILTKKTKPGFWVGIDEKFLVREVSGQSEVGRLDNGALNCVAQRVVEHFDQAKRGHGLTNIRRQKIDTWEKKMRIPGARVQDVAELEKILKRPITLLDITHGKIFNSGKYRSGKYEEIEMVVHNGHAFPRNQHFPRDRMVEYYKNDTWEAINSAFQGPQAIWLMGVGDETQRVSQFVLEDGRTFRTWKKHTEIIGACKQLVSDAINWQYQEGVISNEKKSILSESLKVVDLAEQVFGANHVGSRLANEINEWYPISEKINEDIKQACVEHGHGGR